MKEKGPSDLKFKQVSENDDQLTRGQSNALFRQRVKKPLHVEIGEHKRTDMLKCILGGLAAVRAREDESVFQFFWSILCDRVDGVKAAHRWLCLFSFILSKG